MRRVSVGVRISRSPSTAVAGSPIKKNLSYYTQQEKITTCGDLRGTGDGTNCVVTAFRPGGLLASEAVSLLSNRSWHIIWIKLFAGTAAPPLFPGGHRFSIDAICHALSSLCSVPVAYPIH